MDEQLRQDILGSMGVRVLTPRYKLSLAKPSPQLETSPGNEPASMQGSMQDQSMAGSTPAEAHSEQPAEKVSIGDIRQSLGLKPAEADTQAEPKPEELSATYTASSPELLDKNLQNAGQNAASEPLRYRHTVIRVNDYVMILNQPELEFRFAKESQRFFSDIYFFLTGEPVDAFLVQTFEWPPGKGLPQFNDPVMAKETELNFVKALVGQETFKLVLWGEELKKRFHFDDLELGGVAKLDVNPVLLLRDLEYYLANPSSKKLLWQHLQNLR